MGNHKASAQWCIEKNGFILYADKKFKDYLKTKYDNQTTINTYYSDVLKIYEEFGRWYLEYLKQDFKLSDLPECFKSRFAQRYIQSLLAKPFSPERIPMYS